MMATRCTWLLPGLRGLLAGPEAELWRRWLGRAQRLPDADFGARQAFADALGVDLRALPWASACASSEMRPQTAATVLAIADPLQTRVEAFSVRVMGIGIGQLGATLVDLLLADLNDYLAEEALTLVAGAQRWYLCGDRAAWPDPAAVPPDSLLGSSLGEHLPDALQWRRLINELQVYLNQYPPLQASKKRGQGGIDSLWFWGGASAEQRPTKVDWLDVEEGDFKALAGAFELATGTSAEGTGIVEGEAACAAAIADQLRNGTLRLNFASGERYSLRPRDRWRFWVAPLPTKNSP